MIDTEPTTAKRWELSAPESLVLREGTRANPAEVVKLAVLELVTRRVLRLVEVDGRDWRGRPKGELVIGAGSQPAPLDGPLAPVARAALEAEAKTYPDGTVGLSLPAFSYAFRVRNANSPTLYVQRSVLPALEARGLFASRPSRWLGRFGSPSWTRTPEGDRALARLDELTATAAREAAVWSERDPKRLAVFLATAGGAALLVPAAFPVFEAFAARLGAAPDDGGAIVAVLAATTAGDDAGPDGGMSDLAAIDVSGLSLDFSAISGLDGGLAGMDASLAAGIAGADGGGGAGGDGGGSSGT